MIDDDGDVPIVRVASGAARGVTVRRARGGGMRPDQVIAPAARPWQASGAVDVETLAIWAYRDQRVDQLFDQGLHAIEAAAMGGRWQGRTSDGCADIADIAHIGTRIDRISAIVSDDVHPAAEAVAWAIGGVEGGGVVAWHARLGGRPEGWQEPKRWFRAVTWREPWVEAQPELFRGKPTHCEIIRTASADEVRQRRAEYRRWWDALDQLAWVLSMRALGFVVLRPAAPREPWSDEQ